MEKSILISIRPQWLAKIMNSEKTIEIRKLVPKWVLAEIAKGNSVDFYCYCTKAKPYLIDISDDIVPPYTLHNAIVQTRTLNGLIPCKFSLKSYHKIYNYDGVSPRREDRNSGFIQSVCKHACLSFDELQTYLKDKNGFVLDISNLEIFDKPMQLGNFYKRNPISYFEHNAVGFIPITRAPQSMQTVYVRE